MIGTSFVLPFLAALVGALFSMSVNGQAGLVGGAEIGFGVGFAIVAVVWLIFAVLKRLVE